MGREIKRVTLDFDWPLDKPWKGYVPDENDATWDEEADEYLTKTGEVWKAYDPPTGEGWQVWETVSEGSPITPVFPTAEALIEHLSTVGTEWDRTPGPGGRPPRGPWRREAAEAFVRSGWAPSFVGIGGQLLMGGNDADLIEKVMKS